MDALVVLAAIGSVMLLVRLGLGLTFFADEWSLIADRDISLDDFLRPFNEHWLGVTTVVYRAMFGLVGMHTYVPYLALLAILHAVVALLVYVLIRRRTIAPVAVGMTVIVLLLGSGFENLFWGIQIGFVGATALGFGALVLLDDVPTLPGTGRAIAATALLTVAVMTSGYGLFLLGLVGVDVLLDPRRRRRVIPLLVPVAVYGAWYLTLGRAGVATHGDPFSPERILAVPAFVAEGLAAGFAAASGWGTLGGLLLGIAVTAWVAVLAVRRRAIPGRAIACLLAICGQYGIIALVRSQLGADAAGYTRYAYLSAMLALICLASLVGRPSIPPRMRPWVMAAGAVALAVSLVWNLALLVGGRDLYAQRAELTRALVTLATTDPLPPGVDENLSLVLVPSPREVRELVAAHGTPMTDVLAPGAVRPVSSEAMDAAVERAQHPPEWLLEQAGR